MIFLHLLGARPWRSHGLPRFRLTVLGDDELVALIVSAAGLRRAPTTALVCRQWLDVTKRTVASAPALDVFMCVLHDHALCVFVCAVLLHCGAEHYAHAIREYRSCFKRRHRIMV